MSPSARDGNDRRDATAASSPTEQPSSESSIADIDPDGDLVLCISHESAAAVHVYRFRVSSTSLKANSRYFAGLLQSRFGESQQVETKHEELRNLYSNWRDVPKEELPVVNIQDVGRISTVKSIQPLCSDFLRILHDLDTPPVPPVANLANLAIVADRFDSLKAACAHVRRKRTLRAIDGKTTAKVELALSEEKVRQRLLVGILLDHSPWTERYSARMIIKGWVDRESDDSSALWWDLPGRVEEELAYRRSCVLETIQSPIAHFLKIYTSRERQCRLGYDSSPQCDSFQLGEMVRFFSRIGTAAVRGTIIEDAAPLGSFDGDGHVLMDTLRQVPEYQIDAHHHHCGIRTRLIPILDTINECLQHIGICQECWFTARHEHSWMDTKRPLLWRRQLLRLRTSMHQELHANVRAVFTAVERDWSA